MHFLISPRLFSPLKNSWCYEVPLNNVYSLDIAHRSVGCGLFALERVGAGRGQLGRQRRSPQEARPLPGLCGRWVNSVYPLGASRGLPSVTSWFSVPPSLPATTLRPELCPGWRTGLWEPLL